MPLIRSIDDGEIQDILDKKKKKESNSINQEATYNYMNMKEYFCVASCNPTPRPLTTTIYYSIGILQK